MLTTLSIPTSCLTETWFSSVPSATGTKTAAIVLGNPHDTNCWPGNRNLGTTISPAVCPGGYMSACDIEAVSRRDESETVWACCPSKFYCDGGIWSCLADRTDGVTKTYVVTDIDFFGNTFTTQVTSDKGINAHSIRIAFHSSDILNQVSSTTDSIHPTEAPAPTSTTSLSTSTSEAESSTAHNSESWPAGAWIGIGVGGALGVIALLSSILWLVRRRLKRKQQLPALQNTPCPSEPNKPAIPEIYSTTRPAELNGAGGLYELDPNNTALATGRRVT
ncbi:hypothetical protein F4801DRAFT_598332 [Xylaria longipes]|nr:hypothetical protein F4801DRAFT_598332 [Xylaria longipes]